MTNKNKKEMVEIKFEIPKKLLGQLNKLCKRTGGSSEGRVTTGQPASRTAQSGGGVAEKLEIRPSVAKARTFWTLHSSRLKPCPFKTLVPLGSTASYDCAPR